MRAAKVDADQTGERPAGCGLMNGFRVVAGVFTQGHNRAWIAKLERRGTRRLSDYSPMGAVALPDAAALSDCLSVFPGRGGFRASLPGSACPPARSLHGINAPVTQA